MKKIFLLIVASILLSGCEDFLNKTNPENEAADFFLKGDAEADKVVNAMYAALQWDSFYNRFLPMLCMIRSDEGCLTPNASKMEENFITVANYNSDAAEKYTTGLWRDIYLGIMRANFALENIATMPNISDNVKKRSLAEACFFRAFFNAQLVMIFGEAVPVKTALSKSQADFEPAPGSDGELWQQILTDLQQSQALMTEINYTNTDAKYAKGRVSLGTVTAYLGQAYLFYAQMKNKPEYYQKAADELAKVISQQVGTYRLMDNYRDNFTNEKEYNAESIFEIGFSYIGSDVWGGDGANGVETCWIAQNAGMSAGCSAVSPRWWNLAPSNSFLRHYEGNDYRKWMNLWCENGAHYIDVAGVHAYKPVGAQLSMEFPENPYPKGEGGNYLGFRKYEFDFNHAQLNTLIESTAVSSKYSGMSNINFRVLRYADVLLLYAECQILGSTSDPAGKPAAACIAEIRQRANNQLSASDDSFQHAYGNNLLPYFLSVGTMPDSYPNSTDMAVRLQHERLVEFAGEGRRYFDIIRWYKSGNLKDIDTGSATFGSNISSTAALAEMLKIPTFIGKFLLPIPQYELNTNPKMHGNESN